MKIVTLTMNPALDMNSSVNLVQAEHKLRCNKPEFEPGGGGINVSRAIRNLGGESLALIPAGGPNGDLLQELLSNEKINFDLIPIIEHTRLSINVYEKSSTKQYRFIMPGPNLSEEEWKSCLNRIKNLKHKPEYIVISGSLPPGVPEDFFDAAAKIGNEIDAKVIIDSKKISLSCLKECGVFMIKPNLKEFQLMAGLEDADDEKLKAAAQKIINEGKIKVIIISLGAAGVILITKNNCENFRSPTVPIKSKVGAGDSMTAGIVYYLSNENRLEDAVKFGVAAGAAAVMTPGTELCTKEDTERLYNKIDQA
jgi:6-phosphofructokinase 2